MVSAVSAISFANRKPKLLGDATQAEANAQSTQVDIGTTITGSQVTPVRNSDGGAGFERFDFANVVTPANSVMIFYMCAASYLVTAGGSTKDWVLLRDGSTTLSSFSLVAGDDQSKADFHLFIDESPAAGTHSYTVEEDGSGAFGGIEAKITFIQLTNTQDTKNINIIGG